MSKKQKRRGRLSPLKRSHPLVLLFLFHRSIRPRVFVFVFVFARTGQFYRYPGIYCLAYPRHRPYALSLSCRGSGDGGPLALVPDLVGSFGRSSRDQRSITLGVRGGINIMKTKDSGQPGKIWLAPRRVSLERLRIRGTRRASDKFVRRPTISLSSSS